MDSKCECKKLPINAPLSSDSLAPGTKPKAPVGPFAFQVTVPWKEGTLRTFVFMAEDDFQREMWIVAICNACANAYTARQSRPPSVRAPSSSPAAPTPTVAATVAATVAEIVVSKSGKTLPIFPLVTEAEAARASSARDLKSALPSSIARRVDALKALEALLPSGYAGFVVTQSPPPGSLGLQYGLGTYDLIYGYEGQRVTPTLTRQSFAAEKQRCFAAKSSFVLMVYNFVLEEERQVVVMVPPGRPDAPLGVCTAMVPVPNEETSTTADTAQPG